MSSGLKRIKSQDFCHAELEVENFTFLPPPYPEVSEGAGKF